MTAEFRPTFYVLQALYAVIVVLGVVMAVDSQRTKRRRRQQLESIPPEPLLIYAVAGGAYAVLALVNYLKSFVSFLPPVIGMVAIMGSPVMFAFLVAYGLRVVFPRDSQSSGKPRTGVATSGQQSATKRRKAVPAKRSSVPTQHPAATTQHTPATTPHTAATTQHTPDPNDEEIFDVSNR
ncbi:MAG: hypothetical protein LBJ07_04570 [Actinomycetes bacterium]|nr:hypothetical protein [Actinomycetes bacterium]